MARQLNKGATVLTFLDEIITARGSIANLDGRLDISLNDNGTFGQQSILDEVVTARGGLANLDARIDQFKFGKFAIATRNDFFTTTTVIPRDNTPPQVGEGVQISSLSITPQNTGSRLVAIAWAMFGLDNNPTGTLAIFSDLSSDAFGVDDVTNVHTNHTWPIMTAGFIDPGSTAARTIQSRAGPSSGTLRINGGFTSGQLFGTAPKSGLMVIEILP